MLNDQEVAHYLLNNPNFFLEHTAILESVRLFSPYRQTTVSLQERQIEILREKIKRFEHRFTDLLRNGKENEVLYRRLDEWLLPILAEKDNQRLSVHLVEGLKNVFKVPFVRLYLSTSACGFGFFPQIRLLTNLQQTIAHNLIEPYCGTVEGLEESFLLQGSLFSDFLIDVECDLQSLAMVALRDLHNENRVLGLLIMASPSIERFEMEMATDFLGQLGKIVSATLNRLLAL